MHRFLFFLIFNLFIFQSLFSLAPSCVFSPDVNLPILSGAQKEKERVEEDLLRMEKNFVSNDKEVIYQFYVNTVFVAKIKVDKALNLINLIRVDPLKRGEGIGTASLLLMLSDCLIKERDVSELIVIDFTNEMNKVDDIGKKLYLGFASKLFKVSFYGFNSYKYAKYCNISDIVELTKEESENSYKAFAYKKVLEAYSKHMQFNTSHLSA